MKKGMLLVAGLFLATIAFANNVEGYWKTIDDGSGDEKSIVKLYVEDGKLYGDIVKLLNEPDGYDPVCDQCTGALKNQKVIGMTFINGLHKEEEAWVGDDGIVDPDNGKWYDVKIWRDGNTLKVRGYIGFIFRTQTWLLHEE